MPKYKVISPDGDYEYDVIVKDSKKGRKISLYYSDNDYWVDGIRGELFMTLMDTGNNVKISHSKKKLEYDEAFGLRFLLDFHRQIDTNPANRLMYKVTKDKKTIKV